MLRLAMKAIPLRHDAEPLEILFEDDHLLALNKPPGVLTAPKHRYLVWSSAFRRTTKLSVPPLQGSCCLTRRRRTCILAVDQALHDRDGMSLKDDTAISASQASQHRQCVTAGRQHGQSHNTLPGPHAPRPAPPGHVHQR